MHLKHQKNNNYNKKLIEMVIISIQNKKVFSKK